MLNNVIEPGNPTLRVFISYARRDGSAFADELTTGFQIAGIDPVLDRTQIAPGEDWEIRLDGLIAEADAMVLIVTEAH